MQKNSINLLAEQIKNSKTKEYFKEVIRSFYLRNYRSTLMLLSSIATCDLMFKLQELKNNYNDEDAIFILNEIDKLQNSKPIAFQWKNKLIELVQQKTNILEYSDYINIIQLQKHAYLCSNPDPLNAFELFCPNHETVTSHIINILEGLLIKSTYEIKNAIDDFLVNISDIEQLLMTAEEIKSHLNYEYFEKLSIPLKKAVFRSLWVKTFNLQSKQANDNRNLNYQVIKLTLRQNSALLTEYVKNDSHYFGNNLSMDFFDYILPFLNENPSFFEVLNEKTKNKIVTKINENDNYIFTAWFLNSTLLQHLDFIKKNKYYSVKTDSIIELSEIFKKQGLIHESHEILIMLFGQSSSYGIADCRFNDLIYPNLSEFNIDELTKIMENVMRNSQIGNRGHASSSNSHIKKAVLALEPDFDFSPYSSLR